MANKNVAGMHRRHTPAPDFYPFCLRFRSASLETQYQTFLLARYFPTSSLGFFVIFALFAFAQSVLIPL